jgi:hypothetical protein
MLHLLSHLLTALAGIRMAILPAPTQPGGFHGWGAGAGPTGLTNAPGVSAKPGWMPKAFNNAHYVILDATGKPQPAQPVYVPAGSVVMIRAHNGVDAGNQHVIRVAHSPEELTGTGGDPLTPDTEITWPCDNTGVIWVSGTAGDGVRIAIQAGRK